MRAVRLACAALRAVLLAFAAMLAGGPALADGKCDLNTVVGYQVLFAKPVQAFIQNSIRKQGYEGCEPDRVLVFTDNSGVRCTGLIRQPRRELPTAYLFAKNMGDLKLCVDGELFDVTQTN